MSERVLEYCDYGGYPNEEPKSKVGFELIGKINDKPVYKCSRESCEECEFVVKIGRGDSFAGMAGVVMDYSAALGVAGKKFEEAVKSYKDAEDILDKW